LIQWGISGDWSQVLLKIIPIYSGKRSSKSLFFFEFYLKI
jgi:hypothetical protein